MVGTQKVNREELSQVVGSAAALMLFGQGGACIGRTFNLRHLDGGRVLVGVSEDGVFIPKEEVS